MPRATDHESRKREILTAAIEVYLGSAQPVSSDLVCRLRRLNLSPATIRNVFLELEENGYLTHPHTSAGRVPTDQGYRFYVNALMRRRKLRDEDVHFIVEFFEAKIREWEDIVVEVPRIISDFTHYVSLAYFEDDADERVSFHGMHYLFEHPEFSDVSRAHHVVEALEKQEELLDLIKCDFDGTTKVYIGRECPCPRLDGCSVVVARCGEEEERPGRLALIGPKRMAYDEVIPLMDYFSEFLSNKGLV